VGNNSANATDPSGLGQDISPAFEERAKNHAEMIVQEQLKKQRIDDVRLLAILEENPWFDLSNPKDVKEITSALFQRLRSEYAINAIAKDSRTDKEVIPAAVNQEVTTNASLARQKYRWEDEVVAYRKKLDAEFWTSIRIYNAFNEAIITTVAPQMGFIYALLYASAGDYESAAWSGGGAFVSYGVGPLFRWALKGGAAEVQVAKEASELASATKAAESAAARSGMPSWAKARVHASNFAPVASGAGRARNAVPWQYGNTGGPLGSTDRFGNITIQSGLTGKVLNETVAHESVHRFLSPRSGPFQNLRATVMEAGYENSHFLRYVEEALAETYATGSLRQGLAFPLQGGYGLSVTRIAIEGGGYIIVVGGSSYGAYKLSEQLNK